MDCLSNSVFNNVPNGGEENLEYKSKDNENYLKITNNTSLLDLEKNKSTSLSDLKTCPNSGSVSPSKKPTFDDFEQLNDLGRGAYAKVSLMRNKHTNKKYAIKIIDKYFMNKLKKSHEAFIEREILNNCDHPNVIKLNSTFHDKEKLYYVLEYAPKGDLASFLRSQGILSFETGRFYAAEILNAIEYLSSKNIAHRDLKPENIVLDSNMHIKLVDFSTANVNGMYFDKKEMKFKSDPTNVSLKNLSLQNKFDLNQQINQQQNGMNFSLAYNSQKKNLDEIIRSNQLVGTAEYASPEMLSNSVTNCISTDIWALGCIIYKFFHGRTPFKGGSEMVIFDNILNLRYSIKQDVPEIVQDIIKRMLVESPEKRLGSGEKGGDYDLAALKSHEFFRGVNFSNLNEQTPPVKVNPFIKGIEKTKSTGDLNSIFNLKSLTSDLDELNISTDMLSCHSPRLKFKKCQSTQINKNASISEFSFESYSELQEENIIEDYIFRTDYYPNSPVNSLRNDIKLIDEAVFKKREFLMVYTTRKVKLFSNKKLEIWDYERNSLLSTIFFTSKTKIKIIDKTNLEIAVNCIKHIFKTSTESEANKWCTNINTMLSSK